MLMLMLLCAMCLLMQARSCSKQAVDLELHMHMPPQLGNTNGIGAGSSLPMLFGASSSEPHPFIPRETWHQCLCSPDLVPLRPLRVEQVPVQDRSQPSPVLGLGSTVLIVIVIVIGCIRFPVRDKHRPAAAAAWATTSGGLRWVRVRCFWRKYEYGIWQFSSLSAFIQF